MEASSSATVLSTVITSKMLQGVLDEILGILPVCVPVMISFIALRKRYRIYTKYFTLCVKILKIKKRVEDKSFCPLVL